MCVPKTPKVEPIPERQAARLPDQGDPAVLEGARRKRLASRFMLLNRQATLGAPNVSAAGTLGT